MKLKNMLLGGFNKRYQKQLLAQENDLFKQYVLRQGTNRVFQGDVNGMIKQESPAGENLIKHCTFPQNQQKPIIWAGQMVACAGRLGAEGEEKIEPAWKEKVRGEQ